MPYKKIILVMTVGLILGLLLTIKPWEKYSDASYTFTQDKLRTKIESLTSSKIKQIQLIDEHNVVITLTIFANSISQDQTLIVSPFLTKNQSNLASGFEIKPDGLKFSTPVDVHFDFSNSTLDSKQFNIQKISIFSLNLKNQPIPIYTIRNSKSTLVVQGMITSSGKFVVDPSGKNQIIASKQALENGSTANLSLLESAEILMLYKKRPDSTQTKKLQVLITKLLERKDIPLPILGSLIRIRTNLLSSFHFLPLARAEDEALTRLRSDIHTICKNDKRTLVEYVNAGALAKEFFDQPMIDECKNMAERQLDIRVRLLETGIEKSFEEGLVLLGDVTQAFPEKIDVITRIKNSLKAIANRNLRLSILTNDFTLERMLDFVMQGQFIGAETELIRKAIEKMKNVLLVNFEALVSSGCNEEHLVDRLILQAKYLQFEEIARDLEAKKGLTTNCKLTGRGGAKGGNSPPVLPPDPKSSPANSDDGDIYHAENWLTCDSENNTCTMCYEYWPKEKNEAEYSWCCVEDNSRVAWGGPMPDPWCKPNDPSALKPTPGNGPLFPPKKDTGNDDPEFSDPNDYLPLEAPAPDNGDLPIPDSDLDIGLE